ncbi:efflux RND transporter permease subunit [Rapidithrix thailandica]|uniref:Efflux RND transporter permease subunit n=1 Tax=Rapidithrix thailandica TaxID=413964 RepID=A0AAW9SBU6_9BACT
MWTSLAHFVLKYRLPLIILLLAVTGFMGYMGTNVKWSYELIKIVPDDDPAMEDYTRFKQLFGEDANALAIGLNSETVYQLENFQKLDQFCDYIKEQEGIVDVLSISNILYLHPDQVEKRFEPKPLFEQIPSSQAELDSLLEVAKGLKIYEGALFNSSTGATAIFVTFDEAHLNSADRDHAIHRIEERADQFTQETGIDMHIAGLPYVRSTMAVKVKKEMEMFLAFSILITTLILFLFFRSFSPVFFSLLVIGMVIIWTMGTLSILEYKITILTGLLPPILVVIGIPNCIYLLNKYHQEYAKHNNKILALSRIIRKIGIVTLITNTTTAIGFFVLIFTGIVPMMEFGIVATINIFSTFLISIIWIPAVFSYLPEPQTRHIKHLDFKPTVAVLNLFDRIVSHYRTPVYIVSAIILVAAIIGTLKIQALTFMVDDIPDHSRLKQDLAWFEDNFEGVMPLEIIVDTGRKQGIRKRANLQKIEELAQIIGEYPGVTTPMSMVTFLKAANQSYFGNHPTDYRLPSKREEPYVLRYVKNQDEGVGGMASTFVDSTGQLLRVSMKVADFGSLRLDSLINYELKPAIDSVFEGTDLKADITGTTLIFIKGNDYLINNLRNSMIIAFILIAIIMGTLFGNFRIIIISLIPNMLPLLLTAGLMGYLGIPLKPSTALVFSIAFGISVDDSIHFLAKYRQELLAHKYNVLQAVRVSLKETGTSMIYTSIVLFAGFVIFAGSEFGGTIALGALTSTTLLIAMLTNLILLPCLLRSFDVDRKQVRLQPIFEQYDNVYLEDEDEEIDVNLIEVNPSYSRDKQDG